MSEKFFGFALILTGICVVIFFSSQAFPAIYDLFILTSDNAYLRPWSYISNIFIHADFRHLYFNMFALAIFGKIKEKYIGTRNFTFVFFTSAFLSSFAGTFFYGATLGASGAVFGLLGTLTIIRPKQLVWVLGVPMYLAVGAVLWILIDLGGLFYPDNIAHISHLFGMGYGLVYGFTIKEKYKTSGKRKTKEKVLLEKELNDWEEKYMK